MPGVCAVGYGCDDSTGVVQCVALPPGSITRFTWNDVGAISLYCNPPTTRWDAVRVVRKEGSPPSSPDDGDVVFEGRARTFVDYEAQPGLPYYYGAWAVANGLYSPQPAIVSVTADWLEISFDQPGTHTFVSSATHPYLTVYAWGAGGETARALAIHWPITEEEGEARCRDCRAGRSPTRRTSRSGS